jgi:hypothetical protein
MDESVRMRILEGIATIGAGGVVLLALLACGSWSDVRVVQATNEGGEIALVGNRAEAWQKARVEMNQRCGGLDHFEVIEEYDAAMADGGAGANAVADPRIRYACVVPAQQAAN